MNVNVWKFCSVTGKLNEMVIPMPVDEYDKSRREYQDGKTIQEAFPTLNATQREFLLSGMSEEDQNIIYNGEGL